MSVWLVKIMLFVMSRQADGLPVADCAKTGAGTADARPVPAANEDIFDAPRDQVTREEMVALFGEALRVR